MALQHLALRLLLVVLNLTVIFEFGRVFTSGSLDGFWYNYNILLAWFFDLSDAC